MELKIVIPAAGRPELLRRTLTSIAGCEFPDSYAETVVVENGDKCGVEAIVRSFSKDFRFRYMHSKPPNKSAALNRVLDVCGGDEFLVLFDDDVRIAPGTLKAYAEASRTHRSRAMFGGPVAVDYEVPPEPWLVHYLPPSAKGFTPGENPQCRMKFVGNNWALYADDVRRIGGFNTSRGPQRGTYAVGQETDAQQRLVRAGCVPIVVPEARVWHFVPKSRCSTEWSLRRAHQVGIVLGMDYDGDCARFLGYPRWAVRRAVQASLNYALSRCRFDQKTRFERAFELQESLGILRGDRRRRKCERGQLSNAAG